MNFLKQIDKTKIFMLWNGYPSYVCNSRIKLVRSNQCKNGTNKEGNNRKIIWLKFLYLRKNDQSLLSSLTRKKKKCLKDHEKVITCYELKKMTMFFLPWGKVKKT